MSPSVYTEKCPICGGRMTLEYPGSVDDVDEDDAYWECVECDHIEDYGYFK